MRGVYRGNGDEPKQNLVQSSYLPLQLTILFVSASGIGRGGKSINRLAEFQT